MYVFPEHAPAIKSKITSAMCSAIVPELIKLFTIDTIKTNPDSFRIYSEASNADGGCKDLITQSNNAQDLAEQLIANKLIDHGAIRSIRDLASDNIALKGVDPFIERWEALGFIIRSPFDTYPFKDRGVMGVHIELHPDLVEECDLNMGENYDPRYFKWFLSEQSSGFIPDYLQKHIVELLNKAQDPMTPPQKIFLKRLQAGDNLRDNEIEEVINGMYNFMSHPFAEVTDELNNKIQKAFEEDKENHKIIEYFYSGLFSKINHVAYSSKNARRLFETMQKSGLDTTAYQGAEPLQQFGVNAPSIKDKWGEFIQRSILKDSNGNLIDHNGVLANKEYIKRNFEFKNADNLFPAGIPKENRA